MKNMKLLITVFALLPLIAYGSLGPRPGQRRPTPTRQQPVRRGPSAAEIAQARYRDQLATELFGPKGMGPGKPGDILNKKWTQIKDSGDATNIQQLLELAVILTYTPLAVQILKTDPTLDVSDDAKKLFTPESTATYNAALAQAGRTAAKKPVTPPITTDEALKQAKDKAQQAYDSADKDSDDADEAGREAEALLTDPAITADQKTAAQEAVRQSDAAITSFEEVKEANKKAQATNDVAEAQAEAKKAEDAAAKVALALNATTAQLKIAKTPTPVVTVTPPPATAGLENLDLAQLKVKYNQDKTGFENKLKSLSRTQLDAIAKNAGIDKTVADVLDDPTLIITLLATVNVP